jgi:hypothetical protein
MDTPAAKAGPKGPAPPGPSPEMAQALETLKLVNENMKNKAEGIKTETLILDELRQQTIILNNLYKVVYLAGQKFGMVPK